MAKTLTAQKGRKQSCSFCGEAGHKASRHKRDVTKRCTTCLQTLPITDFYFVVKHGKSPDVKYPASRCKQCNNRQWHTSYTSGFSGRLQRLFYAAKKRALTEEWPIDIDLPFLLHLIKQQDGKCYYTGYALGFETGDNGVSIDRKDPSKGYTKDNVVLTSWLVNNMKRHLDESSFLSLCKAITRHHAE